MAQPARNAKTPSGLGPTASQVSTGRAAGKGQRPPGGLWRPRSSNQPLPASLLAPLHSPSRNRLRFFAPPALVHAVLGGPLQEALPEPRGWASCFPALPPPL